MTEDKLLKTARECGFDEFRIIETDQLVFDSRFRQFCETNYCGNYDNNYSCPPACGTPEELKEKALKFSRALVLQTITPVKNIMDDEETRVIKHRHNEMTWNLIHQAEGDLGIFSLLWQVHADFAVPVPKKKESPADFLRRKPPVCQLTVFR